MIKTKTYHITLSDAKENLRIDSGYTYDDTFIEKVIKRAYTITESYIGKDIANTYTTITKYGFSGDEFEIGEGNYISISGITDEDGNDLSYKVETIYNSSFLVELDNDVNNKDITVIYQTGYIELPYDIEQVILMKISDLYDTDRTSYLGGNIKDSGVIERLLNPYIWNGIKNIRN